MPSQYYYEIRLTDDWRMQKLFDVLENVECESTKEFVERYGSIKYGYPIGRELSDDDKRHGDSYIYVELIETKLTGVDEMISFLDEKIKEVETDTETLTSLLSSIIELKEFLKK